MLPELRIVETRKLIVHETVDPARTSRLETQFKSGKVCKNPPLVARLKGGNYVVLDGANRVTVARALGLPHLAVQVVEYHDTAVKLLMWNHVVEGVLWKQWHGEIVRACENNLEPLPIARAMQLLKRGVLCAVVVSNKGACFGVRAPKEGQALIALLNYLVETYKGRYTLHRTADFERSVIKTAYPRCAGFVLFSPLRKRDILHCAENGFTIPSGISRHVIPGRALHVDVPFSLLRAPGTVLSKNKWLARYVSNLNTTNRIRYYSEPVYLYDE